MFPDLWRADPVLVASSSRMNLANEQHEEWSFVSERDVLEKPGSECGWGRKAQKERLWSVPFLKQFQRQFLESA
jgi:hypothetical protein